MISWEQNVSDNGQEKGWEAKRGSIVIFSWGFLASDPSSLKQIPHPISALSFSVCSFFYKQLLMPTMHK